MSGAQKVAGFAVLVVVAFAAAIGTGRAVGPIDTDEDVDHAHASAREESHEESHDEAEPVGAEQPVLDLDRARYAAGSQRLSFTVRSAAGTPITTYEVQHEKLLHLVVVRRDLGGYRHVHPTLDTATGRWSVPLDLDAGSWRVYADFTPTGGSASVAEADLAVTGEFVPAPPEPDDATANVDGFAVHLTRDGGELRLHVQRDGADVTDLEPYLGAYGHLVAIRVDDLSYLHVHPQDGPAGPTVAFHTGLEEPGRYRLFFEFQHGGSVHRADFGLTVTEEGASGEHDH
ncbi:hypothetical protein [Nocardioides sp. LML1-1-1.1]|uniref:hypothetical protein n=1 Tax=Nocardioides sp. LML1-1-1.1 TaxID=3135248 RepID=UPI0034141196